MSIPTRLLLAIILLSCTAFTQPKKIPPISYLGTYLGYNTKDYKGYTYQSQYLTMPDSVRLATDVFLPKKRTSNEQFPTIIYFVRYVRSIQLRKLFHNKNKPLTGTHVKHKEIDFFTSHGYACVIVDLRGSGASFGHRKMEFSNEEVNDMKVVMDWIVEQPWSDQKLATTGISYTGTTAELALSSKHPALKACITRSNIFDLYADMTCPGGMRQTPFIECWKETTVALDNNDFSIFGPLANVLVKGINPVQGDKERTLLNQALEEHKKNFDIFTGILAVESRDDKEPLYGRSCDDFSIHDRLDDIIASKVPIYRISGWHDGALANSVIKGYLNVPNTKKILIGPWDHGPHDQTSPFNPKKKVKFSVYTEMLRFFDFYLKDIPNGIDKEKPIAYFQMGKERFQMSNQWPLATTKHQEFFFSDQHQLIDNKQAISDGHVDYQCDYSVSSTNRSRWNSLTTNYRNGSTHYPDRREMNQKMLLFSSAASEKNVEITGHPEVDLYFSANANDAYFLVYLEDVAPDGKVTYITEGCLRAAFRKVGDPNSAPYQSIGVYHSYLNQDKAPLKPNEITRLQISFQPTSYLLKKGHRLQLSIANADTNHFDLPKEKPTAIKVYYDQEHPSKIVLPTIPQ